MKIENVRKLYGQCLSRLIIPYFNETMSLRWLGKSGRSQSALSCVRVRLSQVSLYRNCDCKSAIGYPDGTRPWRRGSIGPAGPVCCIRHGRSLHPSAPSLYHMTSVERHTVESASTGPIDSSASGMLECSQRMSSSNSGRVIALYVTDWLTVEWANILKLRVDGFLQQEAVIVM